jgi:hypothetical protein
MRFLVPSADDLDDEGKVGRLVHELRLFVVAVGKHVRQPRPWLAQRSSLNRCTGFWAVRFDTFKSGSGASNNRPRSALFRVVQGTGQYYCGTAEIGHVPLSIARVPRRLSSEAHKRFLCTLVDVVAWNELRGKRGVGVHEIRASLAVPCATDRTELHRLSWTNCKRSKKRECVGS